MSNQEFPTPSFHYDIYVAADKRKRKKTHTKRHTPLVTFSLPLLPLCEAHVVDVRPEVFARGWRIVRLGRRAHRRLVVVGAGLSQFESQRLLKPLYFHSRELITTKRAFNTRGQADVCNLRRPLPRPPPARPQSCTVAARRAPPPRARDRHTGGRRRSFPPPPQYFL